MSGQSQFGLIVLVIGLAGTAAVLSNRLSARLRVPAPAFFLVAAVIAAQLWPPSPRHAAGATVERVVTVALAIILFDGGMHIGRRRFRTAAGAIVWTGIAGTLVTAAGTAVAAQLRCGHGLAPGAARRHGGGRDRPGGGVLRASAGGRSPGGPGCCSRASPAPTTRSASRCWRRCSRRTAAPAERRRGTWWREFALQMAVGVAVGVAGGLALLAFMRRVPLPSEGLYSPRVLAGVLVIFGVATVAQGSGFLAVLVAGIIIGDEPAPYKREIERFHSSLAQPGRDRRVRHARPDHAAVRARRARPPGPTASPWRCCWRS